MTLHCRFQLIPSGGLVTCGPLDQDFTQLYCYSARTISPLPEQQIGRGISMNLSSLKQIWKMDLTPLKPRLVLLFCQRECGRKSPLTKARGKQIISSWVQEMLEWRNKSWAHDVLTCNGNRNNQSPRPMRKKQPMNKIPGHPHKSLPRPHIGTTAVISPLYLPACCFSLSRILINLLLFLLTCLGKFLCQPVTLKALGGNHSMIMVSSDHLKFMGYFQ
jgi:hypothetical protein